MKRRLVIAVIAGVIFLNLSGCGSHNKPENNANGLPDASSELSNIADESSNTLSQISTVQTSVPQISQDNEFTQDRLVSYWDEFAKSYGGSNAQFNQLPKEVDLLPLYIAGMRHTEPYVRWTCAYKAFEYHLDERKPEIIKALQPLLSDPVQQVRDAAKFSTEVLAETFSGPEFVPSPNGKYIAFTPFLNTRFNDGKLWVYYTEKRHISMVLKLISVGGDSGAAGYIQWSPDGSKLAVGDGGRLWSDTVILNLDDLTVSKRDLISYLMENGEKFGYNIGDYQRPDPAVRFVEWSPDSKKVLLSYYFAEGQDIWQSGYAVYNCETDEYERIMPNKASNDEYPLLEKPDGFKW